MCPSGQRSGPVVGGWWWVEGSWQSSGIRILITAICLPLNQPGNGAQTSTVSPTAPCLSYTQSLSQRSSLSSLLVCPFFIPDAPSANVKTTVDVISPGVRGLRCALCRPATEARLNTTRPWHAAESLTQKTHHLPGLSEQMFQNYFTESLKSGIRLKLITTPPPFSSSVNAKCPCWLNWISTNM